MFFQRKYVRFDQDANAGFNSLKKTALYRKSVLPALRLKKCTGLFYVFGIIFFILLSFRVYFFIVLISVLFSLSFLPSLSHFSRPSFCYILLFYFYFSFAIVFVSFLVLIFLSALASLLFSFLCLFLSLLFLPFHIPLFSESKCCPLPSAY